MGSAREASLDYIVANGGTITNAVSSRAWPGDAAVNVSMVNWVRGAPQGPYQLIVEAQTYAVDRIPTHLQLHADVSGAASIAASSSGMVQGVGFGHEAFRSGGAAGFSLERLRGNSCIRPVATGDDLLRGRMAIAPDYCIDLRGCTTEAEARATGGEAFEHLKQHVFPLLKARAESGRETNDYATWLQKWWKPINPRDEFFRHVAEMDRIIVCPKVSARPSFAFASTRFVPNNTVQMFGYDDDYTFGIVQSKLHWEWAKAKGNRVAERIQYSAAVWTTFPWPQEPSDEEVAAVASAARGLRRVRDALMKDNGWSLRALYQASEVPGRHPLIDAQAALDDAVRAAYGIPADQETAEFLLELNKLVADDEGEGRQVQGPGLPRGLDAHDPRWTSEDCIEPPREEGERG